MTDVSKYVKAVTAILFLSLVISFLLRGRDYARETLKVDASVLDIIRKSGISERDLVYERQERYKSGRHSFLKIVRHYEIEPAFDIDKFTAEVKERLARLKFNFIKSTLEKEKGKEKFSVFFSFKNKVLYELKLLKDEARPLKPEGAKIAIVLDDFGYNINNLDLLFGITSPLTISILPNLAYSKRIAEGAGKRNFEIILHLPLEPHDETVRLEEGTIMVGMSREEINNLLVKAIKSVPGLKGISNHMGSKAMENRILMKEVFTELQKRGLYFLDNLVADKSVCREISLETGLRTAARSVFLDNESDESYIEKQLLHTADLAAKTGWAIGVGHDKLHTIRVLTKILPRLEKAGFKFVYVSDLVQ